MRCRESSMLLLLTTVAEFPPWCRDLSQNFSSDLLLRRRFRSTPTLKLCRKFLWPKDRKGCSSFYSEDLKLIYSLASQDARLLGALACAQLSENSQALPEHLARLSCLGLDLLVLFELPYPLSLPVEPAAGVQTLCLI